MTLITVIAPRILLQEIDSLIEDIKREEKIQKNISDYRSDSLDFQQSTTILALFFSGTIAVTQIINTIINLQNKKSSSSKHVIEIKIETIHNHKKDLKIHPDMNTTDIKNVLQEVEDFIEKCSSKNKKDFNMLSDIFLELNQKLSNIKIKEVSKKIDPVSSLISSRVDFQEGNLRDLIFKSETQDVYLENIEAEKCKELFFYLEELKVLLFQEISDDFYMIDLQKILVRYKVYKLERFIEIPID